MALLKYLVPKDGLPDPKGSLSQSIPSRAIAAANDEVTKATSGAMNKRGPYRRYSPEERMEIGRYSEELSPEFWSGEFWSGGPKFSVENWSGRTDFPGKNGPPLENWSE